ncbi:N-acetylglucosaminyl-diphospho-decaprenol L-rhamnosyltransferase [Methylophilaceae bacterium]|nr:N-acetylglucosaminyl-diphospho-decaprenol L-rhamnosyltransferase [Methylophilaceae bacterium]
MDISVILVSYNTAEITKVSLQHLFASKHDLQMEVFIIDNASRDNSVEVIRSAYPEIPLIENKVNVGFGRANNQALPFITGRYVLLLNTDAFVEPDTIAKTVAYMDEHPKCGILGVKLIGENGELQPSCRYFPTPWRIFLHTTGLNRYFRQVQMVDDMDWGHDSVRQCDWVPGCYYLIRREVIDQVGMFDPLYFMYCEEVDHCYATKKAGWDVTYFPVPVVHIGGQSAKTDSQISTHGRQIKSLQIESELLYFRKNHGMSGVLAHLFLTTLVDILLVVRNILRMEPMEKLMTYIKNSFFVWKTFFRTNLAKKSTR